MKFFPLVMLIFEYVTTVMYVDQNGYSFTLFLTAVIFVMSTTLIVSTSPSAEYISEQPVVIDVSFSIFGYKAGGAAVVNFQEEYVEYYFHGGRYKGIPGVSLSIGTVYNYYGKGGFSGAFISVEVGYFIGINHSFDPRDINNNAKSSSIVFSSGPMAGVGGDYYWHLEKLTNDWS
jgi:hypothetical protein